MREELLLRMENGAAVIVQSCGGQDILVRTSSTEVFEKTLNAATVGVGRVAGVVLDILEAFTKEMSSREFGKEGKVIVTFGISGAADAGLKIVSAKGEAFMTIQMEFATVVSKTERR